MPGHYTQAQRADGLPTRRQGQRARKDNREEAEAYLILRGVCAPFVPEGEDPHIVEAQVWSLIHGFTLLYLGGEFGCADTPIEDSPFEAVMALIDRIGTQATG